MQKMRTPDSEWDTELWRETFGDLSLMPLMVTRLEASLNEDIVRLRAADRPEHTAMVVHRMVGGMRIFGESPEALAAEAWEHELRSEHGRAALADYAAMEAMMKMFVARLRKAAHGVSAD